MNFSKLIAFALFILLKCSWIYGQEIISSKPNLVFILADDLGYGDLECYGHTIVKTPNVDALARNGIQYMQYYAPAPLCSPSRAGILTGRTPYRTGIRSWIPSGKDIHLGANEITIAHLLKQEGYQTAVMGKLHLNGGAEMVDQPQAVDMGFDYSFIIHGGWIENKEVEKRKDDNTLRHGKMYPDNFYRNGAAIGKTNKFSAELVADEAIQWMESLDEKKPFFLYLPFSEVHTPVASPKAYTDVYKDYITSNAKENPDLCYRDWVSTPYRGQGEYYANISFLDAQVGRIVQKLKEQDILENTIIIFTSDNGPVTRETRKPWEVNMAGETAGLRGRKDNLLEGGIRVPAIISFPSSIKHAQKINTPVYGLDWLPTLAEIMQFDLPKDRIIDGQSIGQTLSGGSLDRRRPMIWSIDMPDQDDPINEWAIRDEEWKLIVDRHGGPKFLFNLSDDPFEVINLVKKELEIVMSLQTKLTEYKTSIENDSVRLARL